MKRAVDRNGLAFNFVGPAGIVAVTIRHQRKICSHGILQRLAIVERFEHGQFFFVLVDKVGELADAAAALPGGHFAGPRAGVESLTGGFDGLVNIGLVAFSDLGDYLAGGRIDGVKSSNGCGVQRKFATSRRPRCRIG
jgi:hypothetical protein